MKTAIIKAICPSYGPSTVLVHYKTTEVHSDHRYDVLYAEQVDRGESLNPKVEIDPKVLLRMNSQEEIETEIVRVTQGALKRGLEKWDWAQSGNTKKVLKKKVSSEDSYPE